MKFIETKVHGWLDYSVALLMIAMPWLMNFNPGGWETWIFVGLGGLTIIYSLCTDYELGLTPQLTMRTHLVVDTLNGILLAASPWLFSFADHTWKPHLLIGIAELFVVLFSKSIPSAKRKSRITGNERLQTSKTV
jgi:hypothetical protein